jgi:hypothetical protein
MTFAEGQILYRQSLVLYWHAVIVSGQYKHHQIKLGDRDATADEKLDMCVSTMRQQSRLLGEAAELLPAQYLPTWNHGENKPDLRWTQGKLPPDGKPQI